MNKVIIDAENAVLGRLASFAAKQALLGKEVIIMNSEKAIVIGSESTIMAKYRHKKALGGWNFHGPFLITVPERIVKRTIRGMLPHRETKGKEALKRIKAYVGKVEGAENAVKFESKNRSGVSVGRISQLLRGGVVK